MTEQKPLGPAVEKNLTEEEMAEQYAHMDNPDTEKINEYECEVCDKRESLTEADAYKAGWDYPPFIGIWGVVSPRTCPNCTIEKTAYWAVLTSGTADLSEKHEATIRRILGERLVVTE